MRDRTNQVVRGVYRGQPYRGAVGVTMLLSGETLHTVDLFDDIEIFGELRSVIVISETDDFSVDCEDVSVYLT